MPAPLVGLSLMLEDDFLRAAYPLFEAGQVDVLEWSFDTGWPPVIVPTWAEELLQFFSDAGRLVGHGVSYSALSAGTEELQQIWLQLFAGEIDRRRYRHVSEHFGFSSTRNFHQSAPLPVPLTPATLRLGRDRLQQLAELARLPVGLENLAFAFSLRDVLDQGRFLEELLSPVNGFVVLDLHNLYCQSLNFEQPFEDLLSGYPLTRVRELHLAGGSWSNPTLPESKPIRRDTHDGPVPNELFAVLPEVLRRCPQVDTVILERMGGTLSPHDGDLFRRDFLRLKETIRAAN
jgi:uncharacterized protein (UPF0276 family)